MDLDTYVAAHRPEWDRLEQLSRRAGRPRRLSGPEIDELVDLYQRAATSLSIVRTRSPSPAVVDALSGTVTRGRGAVVGARETAWRTAGTFLATTFPAAVWERRRWVVATAVAFVAVSFAVGLWVESSQTVQDAIAPPATVRQLVDHDFANYYRANPAGSFAAEVWTNNALVAATAIAFGALLGIPTVLVLLSNALNVGASGGFLAADGHAGEFFTLILPHGMLELTAVFVASAVGLRLGWSVIDAGRRPRAEALAAEGRAAVGVALGLVVVLAVSGAIEAFVTPSSLPPWARLGIGAVAELAFVAIVVVRGRRAARTGLTGDLDARLAGDTAPVA